MRDVEDWFELGGLLRSPDGAVYLAEELLRVRTRCGSLVPLRANAAQSRFEERRGSSNIVLKARQMGMSTWIAGRFLLKTLLVPGTVTLMVAHTQESAEAVCDGAADVGEPAHSAAGVAGCAE